RPYRHDVRAHNLFAAAFSLADDFRAAAHQFAATRGVATDEPWYYLNGGEEAYHREHQRVTQALRGGHPLQQRR
ncbi:hypothetical protein ACFQ07_32125, partial [Actinomadura adrarensis]